MGQYLPICHYVWQQYQMLVALKNGELRLIEYCCVHLWQKCSWCRHPPQTAEPLSAHCYSMKNFCSVTEVKHILQTFLLTKNWGCTEVVFLFSVGCAQNTSVTLIISTVLCWNLHGLHASNSSSSSSSSRSSSNGGGGGGSIRGCCKSLDRPTCQYHRTESIVSLERRVCSCAELQVFSCYGGWKEAW